MISPVLNKFRIDPRVFKKSVKVPLIPVMKWIAFFALERKFITSVKPGFRSLRWKKVFQSERMTTIEHFLILLLSQWQKVLSPGLRRTNSTQLRGKSAFQLIEIHLSSFDLFNSLLSQFSHFIWPWQAALGIWFVGLWPHMSPLYLPAGFIYMNWSSYIILITLFGSSLSKEIHIGKLFLFVAFFFSFYVATWS